MACSHPQIPSPYCDTNRKKFRTCPRVPHHSWFPAVSCSWYNLFDVSNRIMEKTSDRLAQKRNELHNDFFEGFRCRFVEAFFLREGQHNISSCLTEDQTMMTHCLEEDPRMFTLISSPPHRVAKFSTGYHYRGACLLLS